MTNCDTDAAWHFHNSTKHSYDSVRTSPHFLDWSNQPRLFKTYRSLNHQPLPAPPEQTSRSALAAIGEAGRRGLHDTPIRLKDLAAILYFSAGIYLFSPADFSLVRIREGDFRGALVHATAGQPAKVISSW